MNEAGREAERSVDCRLPPVRLVPVFLVERLHLVEQPAAIHPAG